MRIIKRILEALILTVLSILVIGAFMLAIFLILNALSLVFSEVVSFFIYMGTGIFICALVFLYKYDKEKDEKSDE